MQFCYKNAKEDNIIVVKLHACEFEDNLSLALPICKTKVLSGVTLKASFPKILSFSDYEMKKQK